jgi:endonuclease/exonuclease/phosphatase family metal-dependent hydrolase
MTIPQEHISSTLLESPFWFNKVLSIGEKVLSRPGLDALQPFFQKVKAIAEPTRQLAVQLRPQRETTCSGGTVSILSANLWHDWPRFRKVEERLERLARLVEREGVDILLLQEVSRTPDLHVDEWLSERLGMSAVYSRANGKATAIGFEEGMAILSHLPLSEPRVRQLGICRNPFVRRLALSADVMTESGRLALFSVHLGLLPHHNTRQLSNLLSWVKSLAHNRPALIGGDFNAHEDSAQIRGARESWLDTFRHLHPHAEGVTHELQAWGKFSLSRRRLDYIFFKQHLPWWQIEEACHIDAPGGAHSDHRAVLLRLKPGISRY